MKIIKCELCAVFYFSGMIPATDYLFDTDNNRVMALCGAHKRLSIDLNLINKFEEITKQRYLKLVAFT